MSMAINQGWCIEAICDRCTYTEFLPYSKTTETEALLITRGWRVEKRLLCPQCKKALEQAEAQTAEAKKGGRRLWRRR